MVVTGLGCCALRRTCCQSPAHCHGAPHGDQAGAGVEQDESPNADERHEEPRSGRSQQVLRRGCQLKQPGGAHVVLLGHQVGDAGPQCRLGERGEAGGEDGPRADPGQGGAGRGQGRKDEAQSEHRTGIADDHHEAAVVAVGKNSGQGCQEDEGSESAHLDDCHGGGRSMGAQHDDR